MELVFGDRDGDHIRFEVQGPIRPDRPGLNPDWYRSQLNVEIDIRVGTFRGGRPVVMFTDDFHRFRAAFERLAAGETTAAWLETGDYLAVDVTTDGAAYTVRMQLDALEQDGARVLRAGGEENWEWRLTMSHSSFDALADATTQVSERYPTWSV